MTGAIPSAAASLAFELHRSGGGGQATLAIRAVMQNGPSKAHVTLPLLCASAAGAAVAGAGACLYAHFLNLTDQVVDESGPPAAWCRACVATIPMPCKLLTAAAPPESSGRRAAAAALAAAATTTILALYA